MIINENTVKKQSVLSAISTSCNKALFSFNTKVAIPVMRPIREGASQIVAVMLLVLLGVV